MDDEENGDKEGQEDMVEEDPSPIEATPAPSSASKPSKKDSNAMDVTEEEVKTPSKAKASKRKSISTPSSASKSKK